MDHFEVMNKVKESTMNNSMVGGSGGFNVITP